MFLDYNQNAKDRTVASAYSIRPLPDARVSTPLAWDEVPTVEAEAFTIDTVPARYAAIGDPGDGIDGAVGSLEALLELSRRHEAEGLGDAPWPPNYAKQAGEPPRVQPSRQRRRRERVRGTRPGRRSAAGGGGGAPCSGRAGRPQRGPADRVGRLTPDADRAAEVGHPGRGDRPRRAQGRGAGRARALEGAPSGGGGGPRAGRRPGRLDARPVHDLDARPGQPHPRPGGGPAGPGAARGRLRPVGRLRMAGPPRRSWSGRRRKRKTDPA